MSLGRAGEDRMDDVIGAISKHKDVLTLIELAKNISIQDTFIVGPLLVLQRMFEQSGIDKVLSRIAQKHPKLGFDFKKLIFTMVASRFVKPGSKLKIFEHWQTRFYPEMLADDIELHQLYRALSILSEHKEDIEMDLFWHDRDLLSSEVDVVLYDLTTLRFESTREDIGKLRRFGYSKEKRSDCTQVVLGLLLRPDGVPVGFEVYPGNTFEGHTIASIVQKMRDKFKIRRFIFVADRGLFSAKNLEHMRGNKTGDQSEFIVGMKLGVFKQRHDEFYDLTKFKRINDELAVYETEHENDRCIITWSKTRAERDALARADILAKISKKLTTKKVTAKNFVSNSNYQKYLTGLDDGETPQLNQEAIKQAALKDGFFGVITNIKGMEAVEIIANYKNLWIIEDAFGEIKGNLKARPVFHWTDRNVVGHLTMCFLAYLCESLMTKALREKNIMLESRAIKEKIIDSRPLTVVEAMRELQEVRAIPVQIKSSTIWVRTDIAGNANKLFAAIGLKPPPKILSLAKKSKS
ncbi:MAG: IS1634 family transposase [Candidatus Curtissbacteria bacterium]|nr:IS1634 family transposase [Candidatus Curtissbacteria bacterium]